MSVKYIEGKGEVFTPDVLIPFAIPEDRLSSSEISLIGVRPETNKVSYEAAIIKAVSPCADVVYLANLSGIIINDKAIVACHYSSQLQFAINGKEEMEKYPEMVAKFEKKFSVPFAEANIVGAFEAILEHKVRENADDLFDTMVPDEDFLTFYGHSVKRINDIYILNYDIPFVISCNSRETDMFLIAIRLKEGSPGFSGINHAIYDNMCNSESITLVGINKRKNLPWYEQMRRTYHISRSHIEAMFDLTDYIFKDDQNRLDYIDTPLGRRILEKGILPREQVNTRMAGLKENPLVYLDNEDGGVTLVNIIKEGKNWVDGNSSEKSLDECCDIIGRINWEKSLSV
ncbi:MAG: hypothetical protein GY765_40005 [bacterium]|nr:hypothetical protein [bacterium]